MKDPKGCDGHGMSSSFRGIHTDLRAYKRKHTPSPLCHAMFNGATQVCAPVQHVCHLGLRNLERDSGQCFEIATATSGYSESEAEALAGTEYVAGRDAQVTRRPSEGTSVITRRWTRTGARCASDSCLRLRMVAITTFIS
jgi:hypothetical protein